MKTNVILLSCLLFLFCSCARENSVNVNQDSIFTIYELFYDEGDDKTIARTTFRFGGAGGTLLELADGAEVTFEGDALTYNGITSLYKKEYAALKDSGTFVYTDLDGMTFTNSIRHIEEIGYPQVDSIDATSAYTFEWTGEPVGEGEIISLTIDGTQQDNFEIFSIITSGSNQLILDADRLQKLGEGSATCILKREYNQSTVDQGTSKGGRMAVWYSAPKTIYIKQP